ncbi:hypothetical protein DPEC_G00371410 [Dallia pectoralis]|nr:hypothetical protein DPEC_G00371410 [Dallia pectoralis]
MIGQQGMNKIPLISGQTIGPDLPKAKQLPWQRHNSSAWGWWENRLSGPVPDAKQSDQLFQSFYGWLMGNMETGTVAIPV